MEKEDRFFLKRMGELAAMAEKQYRPVFTEFLTLYEHSMILSSERLASVSIHSWGGYKEAERKLICFFPIEYPLKESDFPISCIHICPKNRKFGEDLSHRDFLGAILNLGIERNRTGDILIQEGDAFVFCESEIADFIESNLERIRHTTVFCKQKNLSEISQEIFEPHVKVIKGFVSSLRLDALLPVAFHVSRSSITGMIHAEKVFLNGKLTKENSILVKENDLISVRGMGKFRFIGIEKESKKGRFLIQIEKYC